MSNRKVLFTVIALGMVVAGLVFAQADSDSDDYEWEMISQRVAGTGGSGGGGFAGISGAPVYGEVFLYNKRTGKVFRYFANCGESSPNGCVVPLRPLHDMVGIPLPAPQSRGSSPGR